MVRLYSQFEDPDQAKEKDKRDTKRKKNAEEDGSSSSQSQSQGKSWRKLDMLELLVGGCGWEEQTATTATDVLWMDIKLVSAVRNR